MTRRARSLILFGGVLLLAACANAPATPMAATILDTATPLPPSPSVSTATVATYYPADTRTGIPIVDAIIKAVVNNDRVGLRALVHYTVTSCTHADGIVRIVYAESPAMLLQHDVGEFILPPTVP